MAASLGAALAPLPEPDQLAAGALCKAGAPPRPDASATASLFVVPGLVPLALSGPVVPRWVQPPMRQAHTGPPGQNGSYMTSVISDGHIGFGQASKFTDTPFPFPYQNLLQVFLWVYVVAVPLLVNAWIKSDGARGAMTFLAVWCYFALHQVGNNSEDPFLPYDHNELPLQQIQHSYNAKLLSLCVVPDAFQEIREVEATTPTPQPAATAVPQPAPAAAVPGSSRTSLLLGAKGEPKISIGPQDSGLAQEPQCSVEALAAEAAGGRRKIKQSQSKSLPPAPQEKDQEKATSVSAGSSASSQPASSGSAPGPTKLPQARDEFWQSADFAEVEQWNEVEEQTGERKLQNYPSVQALLLTGQDAALGHMLRESLQELAAAQTRCAYLVGVLEKGLVQ
mmetsp:Transcript_150312/g.481037  ORF Transcript_150312/g.481037 Transcript_150312/m.481037 type:complete len:394 (+) Transcript_150312:189-1370(+)